MKPLFWTSSDSSLGFKARVGRFIRSWWRRACYTSPFIDYRPQQSWGNVIFSGACVKNSVHMGESASVHAGKPEPPASRPHTPRKQTPPKADTPRSRHPPEQIPPEQTPPPQQEGILLECILVFNKSKP